MAATTSEVMPISIPNCEAGIGHVIHAADSADVIDGVVVRPFDLWPDDRGYFLEAARMGQGLAAGFPAEGTQLSSALSYPGTIKAPGVGHGYKVIGEQPA